MKKTVLLLLLSELLFPLCTACAQTLTGRTVDSCRRPVAGVAVVMLDADSLQVAAAVSDAEGRFSFASAARPCRLLLHHLSYEPAEVVCKGDDAGEILLCECEHALDAVVVKGERPVVKVEQGRLNYDLTQLVRGRAVENAWEALKRLPGVDERDGALTLAGAGGVTVILNGKPSTLDAGQLAGLLQSLPVERVERVEVAYSAPPQYHVRGAVINIVLRRSLGEAFAGEVHAGWTNRRANSWRGGGSLLFSSRSWTVDGAYTVEKEREQRRLWLLSRHTLGGETFEIEQLQKLSAEALTHRLRAAAEYAPAGRGRWSMAYAAAFTPRSDGGICSQGNFVTSEEAHTGGRSLHNIALRYTVPQGLDLSLDYTHYRTDRTSTLRNDYASGTANRCSVMSGQRIDQLDFAADYTRSLAPGWEFVCGATGSWSDVRNAQSYRVLEGEVPPQDAYLRLRETGASLHAGFGRNFAKGALSLSLTGEYYRLGAYEKFALYPQASLYWQPAEGHLLQLSLSTDKQEPSYWELQPSVTELDGYAEVRGTPGLRPAWSYEGQLLYLYRQKYLFLLFWNETTDYFQQTAWQSDERLALVYRTFNWTLNRQWGVMAEVPWSGGERAEGRVTVTGLRQRQRCGETFELPFDRSKWVGRLSWDNTFRLSRKPDLRFEVGGFFQTPAIQATYDLAACWSIDLALMWSFHRGRARLSVRCDDLFDSSLPSSELRYGGQWLDMDTGGSTRTLSVRFSWRLGSYRERERKEADTSRFRD